MAHPQADFEETKSAPRRTNKAKAWVRKLFVLQNQDDIPTILGEGAPSFRK